MTEDQRNDGTIRDLHAMGNPDNLYTSAEGAYGNEEGPIENKLPTGIVATGMRPAKLFSETSIARNRALGKMKGPYLSRGT
jgi:hypothetical protein